MDEERRRILRMLSEGSITVEECEELLKALSERRTEKVVQEVEAARGERPVWPYVLLVALAAVGVVLWLGVGGLFAARSLSRWTWGFNLAFPFLMFGGLINMAALVLWIWMLIDCITRLPCDFRLLFTSRHEYDKWIWIAAIVLTNWVGALVYLVVIRQHGRARAAGVPPQPPSVPDAASGEPFTPSPRARSIIWFFLIGFLLGMCGAVAAPLLLFPKPALLFSHPHEFWVPMAGPGLIAFLTIMALWLAVFWVWMLIDCLARDHREFGTLITSDSSMDKILWLLLILFTFVIGALAYHVAVRRRPRPTTATAVSGAGGGG